VRPARVACACASIAVLLIAAPLAQTAQPDISVWYRGEPPGVPRQNDLAVIRAHGFGGVIWPARHASTRADVERMAAVVDLQVHVRGESSAVTPESARMPGVTADVSVAPAAAPIAPALAWRAIAHGARQIAFDAGAPAGSGLVNPDGTPQRWVADAAALARQFTFNRRLIEMLRAGPAVTYDGVKPPGLDVALLDGGRSWVLVATNAALEPAHAVVNLPAGVPPALWLELLDGTHISMLARPEGPRWTVTFAPGAARVYVIDKNVGTTPISGLHRRSGPERGRNWRRGSVSRSS
jgi:hypothetical protein